MPPCARPADTPLIHPAVDPHSLRIGGLVPCSTVDWPGQLAAVLFLNGCPWRCTYCHNPDMQDPAAATHADWTQVERLLTQRRGLLDGVVFSGGEPTSQAGLTPALARVRELGYATALHTAGTYPARLARLLPLLDWVALDVKTLPSRYDTLTGIEGSAARVDECLALLIGSGIDFECRTTVDWSLISPGELLELGRGLAARGVRRHAVQVARAVGRDYRPRGSMEGAQQALDELAGMFRFFSVRHA